MNLKQRFKKRGNALKKLLQPWQCLNCLQMVRDGHLVPPSFGDKGFYICEKAKTGAQD